MIFPMTLRVEVSALAIFRLARDFGAPGLRHGMTCRGITVAMLVESVHGPGMDIPRALACQRERHQVARLCTLTFVARIRLAVRNTPTDR
jgi:hypothetical protein